MTNKETNKSNQKSDNDFFTDFFTKKHENIEKKSFKKLAFLGLAIGCGIAFGFVFISTTSAAFSSTVKYISEYSTASTLLENKEKQNILNIIEKIPTTEFTEFAQYMNLQGMIYDEKVNFVANSIVNAEYNWTKVQSNSSSGISSISRAESLSNELVRYKTDIDERMKSFQQIYIAAIHKNIDLKKFSMDDLNSFNQYYSNFQSHSFLHDSKLEKEINDALFVNYSGNKEFNQKNSIYDKAQALDVKMNNFLKPKI